MDKFCDTCIFIIYMYMYLLHIINKNVSDVYINVIITNKIYYIYYGISNRLIRIRQTVIPASTKNIVIVAGNILKKIGSNIANNTPITIQIETKKM